MLRNSKELTFFNTNHPQENERHIRLATLTDIPIILDIIRENYALVYQINHTAIFSNEELNNICADFSMEYHTHLNSDNDLTLVICQNEKVLGFARVKITNDTAHLDKLYISPSMQGQGLGSHLLLKCFHDMNHRFNVNQLSLHVWDGNTRAMKLYENNSFTHHYDQTHAHTTHAGTFTGHEMVCEDVRQAYSKLYEKLHPARIIQRITS